MEKSRLKVPKEVYYQCVWLIKDMDRLRRLEAIDIYEEEYENGLLYFVDDEEVIRDGEVIEQAKWKLECIRKAIAAVPEEYRRSTIDGIVYNLPFGDMAHENTWRKWRHVFIRELAKNLYII